MNLLKKNSSENSKVNSTPKTWQQVPVANNDLNPSDEKMFNQKIASDAKQFINSFHEPTSIINDSNSSTTAEPIESRIYFYYNNEIKHIIIFVKI